MPEPKQMTEQELLSADPMKLDAEMLTRRTQIITLRKMERELEVSGNENEEYQIKKKERLRMRQIAVQNSEQERSKTRAEQSMCSHKTGGEGLAGFFQGDGAIYGSCTAGLELPTGEIYYLCFRCQKEWHRPSKRAFLNGEITLPEYEQAEREYIEVSRWPRKSFAPWNGELCAASKFNIPALMMQKGIDDSEFNTFMLKLQDLGPGVKPKIART